MSENKGFLPYGRQSIDEADIAAVTEALCGDFLTTGPLVKQFEDDLAARVDAPHCVACSSGTSALHLAMAAIGIGPGDVVIVPAITFVATANAVLWCGGKVVFADVDGDSGLLTEATFAEALTRAGGKVAAVAPVHLAGQCVDMPAISAIARKAGIKIVEDACHALGTVTQHGPVGNCHHSDATVFSFHPVKTITAGEGGAITTRNNAHHNRMQLLRNHGLEREPSHFERKDLAFSAKGEANSWYYELQDVGYNYRLTDIASALARSQLGKLDRFVHRRRELIALYDQLLAPLAPQIVPLRRAPGQEVGWHLSVVLIDFPAIGLDRQALMHRLRVAGIGTQVHYIPVPWQPFYAAHISTPPLPGAAAYYARALSLPLFPDMTDADVHRVIEALTEAISS